MNSSAAYEDIRQLTHLAVAVAAVLVVRFVGFNTALLLMMAFFLGGLILANFKVLGGKVKLVDLVLKLLDRDASLPAQGAMLFALGTLLLLSFARPLEFGLAIVLLHGAGDAFATIVGMRFNSWLPWNKNKTWHGFFAFIIAGAIAAQFFIPLQAAILYSIVLAIVESLPFKTDDNLTVPIAALLISSVKII